MGKIFQAYIALDGEYYEPTMLKKVALMDPECIYRFIKNEFKTFDDVSLISKEEFLKLDLTDKTVGYPTKIIAKGSFDDGELIQLFLYSDFFSLAADLLNDTAEDMCK